MRYAVVAVAQQGLRLYPDLDAYRRDLERFFRLAEMKHARLIVFPERTGLMVIPPLVEGFRSGLLKKADVSRGRTASWWDRTRSSVMRGTARLLRADIPGELRRALTENPGFIWQKYVEVFSALAYEYKITVVAGSGFFPDVNDGTLHHMATVFGPDGDILGQQAKVSLDAEEQSIVQPGSGWQVILTPLGRMGIVFGEEVMYPEVGRVLAYQGAEIILVLAATREESVARQLHDGLRARVTDNQIFGAIAFTVGDDPFTPEERPPLRGRSMIMAPHGLTPRGNGVLVEAGSSTAEVLVTARWDFDALHTYWESAPIPVRRRLPADRTGAMLAAVYGQGVTLEEAARALPALGPRALPVEESISEAPEEVPQEVPTAEAPSEVEASVEQEGEVTEVVPPEGPAAEATAVEEEPGEVTVEEEAPPEAVGEEEVRESLMEGAPEPEPAAVTPEAERVTTAAEIEAEEEGPPPMPVPEPPSAEAEGKAPAGDETPPVTAAAPATGEEGSIPEELWATIKEELARAAATLRSLREPESARPGPESPPTPSPAREGWFHRLLTRTRAREEGEEWEEF